MDAVPVCTKPQQHPAGPAPAGHPRLSCARQGSAAAPEGDSAQQGWLYLLEAPSSFIWLQWER